MVGSRPEIQGGAAGAEGMGGTNVNDLLKVVATDAPRTVRLIGELDASNADDFLHDLQGRLAEGGDLVLDLSGLTFVDSMGLRGFIRIAAALESTGKLILDGPRRPVARTIALVGLDKLPNIAVVNEALPGAAPDAGAEEGV